MSQEAWMIVGGIALSNLFALIGGFVNITNRLTRIETDISWIKRNQHQCPQNSENPLQ